MPGNGTIMVCQCRVPAEADAEVLARGLALLPLPLQSEVTRYLRLEDRLARLTARLLIRKTLHALTFSQESSLDLWQRDANGRPLLAGSRADFSISHANPWVVTAVGINRRVGIDVETFRSLELDSLLPYLTQAEAEQLRNTAQPEKAALHCWSMREAILKADGRGLLAPEETIRDIKEARTPAGDPWQVERLRFEEGCLYLACDRPASPLTRAEWSLKKLLDR